MNCLYCHAFVATLELKIAKSKICETSHELISTSIIKVSIVQMNRECAGVINA